MAEMDDGSVTRTVLVATSGDTGSAVAHAFHGLAGYRVVMNVNRLGGQDVFHAHLHIMGGRQMARLS